MNYDQAGCGCCKELESFPARIANRASLSAIGYRIGGYEEFRNNLLAGINAKKSLAGWRSRDNLDYGIAVLDLWAYVADILTFYQERIANEAFLRTATLRESVMRLAGLIGYRLGPGAAAVSYLAFTLDRNKSLVLPTKLRVQSVPGQNEKPQKFETIEQLAAEFRFNKVAVYPLPVGFNPFEAANTEASMSLEAAAALAKPLIPGEKLLLYSPSTVEVKQLDSAKTGERELALGWRPPVQAAGLDAMVARMVAYNRVFGVFGADAPASFMRVTANSSAPGGFVWTLQQRVAADFNIAVNTAPPAVPEIPLAQKVEDIKPGTRVMLAGKLANGQTVARVTTVDTAETRSASFEPLTGPVTHLMLGIKAVTAPVAISGSGNRQFVFAIADDGAAWIKIRGTSVWRDWQSLGGSFVSMALERGSSQFWRLFAVGADGNLYLLAQTGSESWGAWQDLGGQGTAAAAARPPGGLLTVALQGASGNVFVKRETEANVWEADWSPLGGNISQIATAFGQDNTLYVFGIGADNAVWRNRRLANGSWTGWASLGGWVDRLAVARNQDGRLSVFGRGLNQALWRRDQSGGGFTSWTSMGGWIDQLAVTAENGKLVIYVRGGSKTLYRSIQTSPNAASYSGWVHVLGIPFDGLAGATLDDGQAAAFLKTSQGALRSLQPNSSTPLELGYPVWQAADRRTLTVYEVTRDPLQLRNERFPAAISGSQVSVALSSLASVETGRRIILDDGARQPHLAEITAAPPTAGSLILTFAPPLPRTLETATATLQANIAKATHGETVKEEVLGNGDASKRFLTFPLKKSPVTYVPQPGAVNGVASTLELRVGGILWKELPSLFGAGPEDRVFTTTIDDDGKTTVRFGGSPGARVPTGKNNIVGTYRQGLGEDGNVRAGVLTTLLDRPAGLKAVLNPLPAEGGSAAEKLESARANAPTTVQTFGRIVSVRDFEDAARQLAMVAKARSYVDWDGEEQAVFVVVAGPGGTSLAVSVREIAASLDALRDTNRKMSVVAHTPLAVELAVDVIAKDDYTLDAVQATVESALNDLFAFDNRNLGQPVFLSDLYRALQPKPGILAVDVDLLRPKGVAGAPSMADIGVPPSSIATLDLADATIHVAFGSF